MSCYCPAIEALERLHQLQTSPFWEVIPKSIKIPPFPPSPGFSHVYYPLISHQNFYVPTSVRSNQTRLQQLLLVCQRLLGHIPCARLATAYRHLLLPRLRLIPPSGLEISPRPWLLHRSRPSVSSFSHLSFFFFLAPFLLWFGTKPRWCLHHPLPYYSRHEQ